MSKIFVMCIDDQREVLATLMKELIPFQSYFEIVDCESAMEAAETLDDIESEGGELALVICDHVMPGKTGVEFLADLRKDMRFPSTRQVLLTGLATHDDTIEAINKAHINRYVEKPWDAQQLIEIIKTQLTEFLLTEGIEYQPFLPILDQTTLYRFLREMG